MYKPCHSISLSLLCPLQRQISKHVPGGFLSKYPVLLVQILDFDGFVQKQPKRSVSGAKWDSFQLISTRPSKKSPSVKALRGLGSISITMSNYVDIMYWWISWGMAHTVVDMIRLNVHVLVRNFHQSWYHKSNLGWPLQCSCRATTGWPLHRFSTLATFQSLGQMLWP